jgi:hypothetical protein
MKKIEYTVTDFHAPDGNCRGTLADLIIDADIIPSCGLIPPFRVVASVIRTGGGDGGMSPGCIWEPFELREEDFWRAVEKLESLTPADLASRPRVRQFTDELRQDYSAPDTDDYIAWLDSLVTRGYLPGAAFGKVRR